MSMDSKRPIYSVTERELVVVDGETGSHIWAGCPDEMAVELAIPMIQHADAVVLLDYMDCPSGTPCRNLVRINPHGSVIWRAPTPTENPNDAYVDVELLPDGIVASSWSGYSVVIDPKDGRVIKSQFAK